MKNNDDEGPIKIGKNIFDDDRSIKKKNDEPSKSMRQKNGNESAKNHDNDQDEDKPKKTFLKRGTRKFLSSAANRPN